MSIFVELKTGFITISLSNAENEIYIYCVHSSGTRLIIFFFYHCCAPT